MGLISKAKPESNKDIAIWLEKISHQLERLILCQERLILCQEKGLSGEVVKNFDSKQHLQGGK